MYKLESIGHILEDIDKYGGKAIYLSKLIKNDFLVPPGFVISSDIFKDYKDSKLKTNFFEDITKQIQDIFLRNNKRIIFRSSSNIENSDRFSSSGVFESLVYDPKMSVDEHIKKVWNFIEDRYTNSYLDLIQMDKETIMMGVIIQEYIEGNLTLLIQSYDIINNRPHLLIEYTPNGISSIVDGTTNADLIYVNYDGQIVDSIENDLLPTHILKKIVSDCKKMEHIFGAHIEAEAQLLGHDIYYLQARKLL